MLPILVPLILKAAEAVPGLLGLMKGNKAEAVAHQVLDAAKTIAGIDDGQAAVEKVAQDPELLKLWIVEANKVTVAELEADLGALRLVNETMRAEAASNDPVVRWWRPYYGYIFATSWGWLVYCIGSLLLEHPEQAPSAINAIGVLFPMFGVAMAVLGIAVRERSKDKALKAGVERPSLFGSALQAIRPKSN